MTKEQFEARQAIRASNFRAMLTQNIRRVQNAIEDGTGKMFHEAYPEISVAVEAAIDSRDHNEMRKVLMGLEDLTSGFKYWGTE